MNKIIRDNVTLRSIYADADLAEWELFRGGFINFGYWKDLSGPVTAEARAKASADLYDLVLTRLPLVGGQAVLEVGCGKGLGATRAAAAGVKVVAMDIFREQLDRARAKNARAILENSFKIDWVQGSACEMPFQNGVFDHIFSVEAAQHFRSLELFFKEARRVLKKGGKISFATYFLASPDFLKRTQELLPWIGTEFEKGHGIEACLAALRGQGFMDIRCESIGENVWVAFDRWMDETEHKGELERNWLKAFRQGLLDYYVVSAVN